MHSLCGCLHVCVDVHVFVCECVRNIMANVKTIADAAVRSQLAGNMIHFQMFFKMFSLLPPQPRQLHCLPVIEKGLACLPKWVTLSGGL